MRIGPCTSAVLVLVFVFRRGKSGLQKKVNRKLDQLDLYISHTDLLLLLVHNYHAVAAI